MARTISARETGAEARQLYKCSDDKIVVDALVPSAQIEIEFYLVDPMY